MQPTPIAAFSFSRLVHPGVFLAALALAQPRAARAEDSVSYKYQDYREAGGRVAVQVQSTAIEKSLGPDMRLKLQGVIDAIAGATPSGEPAPTPDGQVPLSQMHDRRKAWSADLSRQFERVNVALGVANSREHDYVSTGWSVNTLNDFNQKNTTLLLGVAATKDDVKVFYQGPYASKRTADAIVGLTQLLSPQTSVTANLSFGHARGYLDDPYRVIRKNTEILPGLSLPLTYPENRPDKRDRWTVFLGTNHAVRSLSGAVEASYRWFHDTWGTTAHTLDVAWWQSCGEHFRLSPSVRYYRQTATNFYRLSLDGTTFTPALRPRPAGPFYSADYRLASLETWNLGLKAVWTISDRWQFDAAAERYEMRGRDGRTPESAFPRAAIWTLGAKFAW
ncbi:MAG: DUF3570 domain-containing protein [Opitutae bacterium]|nr:DUF3570 domain-containing protein [Opitutae bacterium]